eukprot:1126287-Pyramimonas_sp.AAC.2
MLQFFRKISRDGSLFFLFADTEGVYEFHDHDLFAQAVERKIFAHSSTLESFTVRRIADCGRLLLRIHWFVLEAMQLGSGSILPIPHSGQTNTANSSMQHMNANACILPIIRARTRSGLMCLGKLGGLQSDLRRVRHGKPAPTHQYCAVGQRGKLDTGYTSGIDQHHPMSSSGAQSY